MSKFRKGDIVRIVWKGYYKEGTVISWNSQYRGWELCITSRFNRGTLLIFDESALELKK